MPITPEQLEKQIMEQWRTEKVAGKITPVEQVEYERLYLEFKAKGHPDAEFRAKLRWSVKRDELAKDKSKPGWIGNMRSDKK